MCFITQKAWEIDKALLFCTLLQTPVIVLLPLLATYLSKAVVQLVTQNAVSYTHLDVDKRQPAGTAAANETPKGVRLLNMAARGISNPNNAHRAVRAICRLRGCRFSRVVCFVTAFSFNFSTAIPSIV